MPRASSQPEDGRPSLGAGAGAIAAQELREQESESEHIQHQTSFQPFFGVLFSVLLVLYRFDYINLEPFKPTFLQYLQPFCDNYCMNAVEFYSGLIDWVFNHGDWIMLILNPGATLAAASWLFFRAYKTLRKPVSELIETLGVEVPDAPEVTLARLESTKFKVIWSAPKPGTHKVVSSYILQINGVNVGESSRAQTSIEVTGLRPGHFYNVRIIAVGGNNFQAGSNVLRISTLCKDGRPQQGLGGALSTQDEDDQDSDNNDESQTGHGIEIKATRLPESAPIAMVREPSGGHAGGVGQAGQRRNTGGRKHSPSSAAADQAAQQQAVADQPEESMKELTAKFERTRQETDRIVALMKSESEVFKIEHSKLTKERDTKRQQLNDREQQTERLRKEVSSAEKMNRLAQNKKSQREKALNDKKRERENMKNNMASWKQEIEDMKKQKERWRVEEEKLGKSKAETIAEIRKKTAEQQLTLEGLEREIQSRGLQILDLEAERKQLPGSEENEESMARDALDKRQEVEWQANERAIVARLNSSALHLRDIQIMIPQQQAHLTALEAAFEAAEKHQQQQQSTMFTQGNSSGVDFDASGGQGKAKPRRTRTRKSRTSTISSPISAFPIVDSQFPNANVYNNFAGGYVAAPYTHMNNDTGMVIQADHMAGMSEDDIRSLTAGAPLSPTATSLLPSDIFTDDDHDSRSPPFGHAMYGAIGEALDKDPQSPDSSSRSASLLSSPHNSTQHLALYGVSSHDYVKDNDRRPVKSPLSGFANVGSSSTDAAASKGLKNLFGLPRARGKATQDESPALGSLKHGQSQSFPLSTDEPDSLVAKRRISFTTGWPSFFNRSSATDSTAQGNAPAPARQFGARSRGFPIFKTSVDDTNHRSSDRDPSSPRPLSIASSDLPRPSTDSAPFGWGPPPDAAMNRNSPLGGTWSMQGVSSQTWSRNPSRRPSIQHGSTSAVTTGIASDDDEFLPSSENFAGQSSPPPIGVIGTRPISSHKPPTPKLNPAAPAFTRNFLDKGKGKGKAVEAATSMEDLAPHDTTNLSSPAASRKSRDTHSIRTQNSMAESHESLDRAVSSTTSDFPSGSSVKEKNTIRQLLRKGSSTKFGISSFSGKGNIFSKKGTSSTPNSDRENRDSSFDEFGEESGLGRSVDSVTSSPMLGSGEWKGKDKEAVTPKEGRMSNWGSRFTAKKKGKGRESSEVERSEAEVTGDEDNHF